MLFLLLVVAEGKTVGYVDIKKPNTQTTNPQTNPEPTVQSFTEKNRPKLVISDYAFFVHCDISIK